MFAIFFRVLGIGAHPILEDDAYRFLWDGYQTLEHGTPYFAAPADFFDQHSLSEKWEGVLGSINHPEIASIYGPTAQYSFALAYLIAPGEIWALQLVYGIADCLLIILLCKLTSVRNVMLYAWSPLILKEFSFSAHPDVLGALFLVLGYFLLSRARYSLCGAALALALGVKIFALIVIPLFLLFNMRAWLSFISVALMISLPFGPLTAWLPPGLSAMGGDWVFNAPIYLSLIHFVPLIYVKYALASLLAVILFALFVKQVSCARQYGSDSPRALRQLRYRVLIAFAALLLCSPVVNPWYLVWLLTFAALQPTAWAWLASVCAFLAYVSGINLADSQLGLYEQPLWLVWLEYGTVLVGTLLASRVDTIDPTPIVDAGFNRSDR